MLELATDDLPVSSRKSGRSIKAQRVPPAICVSTTEDSGTSGLHIYPRGHKIGRPVSPMCYRTDAKKIYAWMVWHLPAGTMEKLRDLILSKEVA